jgi:hypothetical protein
MRLVGIFGDHPLNTLNSVIAVIERQCFQRVAFRDQPKANESQYFEAVFYHVSTETLA